MSRNEYASRVLRQYKCLPGTCGRILRADRRLALALYDRGVQIGVVQDAFVLAVARRRFRSDADTLEPIRSLHYLVPLIQELLHRPPGPGYLQYLRHKLLEADIHLEA